MKRFTTIFFFLLSIIPLALPADQIHDILIIGKDTILLKSFPLEELNFQTRPFRYGRYDFPGPTCWRGYQATWKVIDNKLFLVEISKVDATHEKTDIVKYFSENNYNPIVMNGLIFADWFSFDLGSFPKDFKYWGCVWKPKPAKPCKACIRFEKGVLVYNRYKARR